MDINALMLQNPILGQLGSLYIHRSSKSSWTQLGINLPLVDTRWTHIVLTEGLLASKCLCRISVLFCQLFDGKRWFHFKGHKNNFHFFLNFRSTALAADAFLDSFQRLADAATGSKGKHELNVFYYGIFIIFTLNIKV